MAAVAALVAATAAAPHDLHIAYGDLAVEGSVIAGRIRIFKDDLELALGPRLGVTSTLLEPGPEADALVMEYVRERLTVSVDGQELGPILLQAGQDEMDREPVWWVTIQYQAPGDVSEFVVRNELLFELFEDQRNVFKFVRFPDQVQRTYYFAPGEAVQRVSFDDD
jgi:hypothetical protein